MIIAFDLDGTLANCEHRLKYIDKDELLGAKPDWDRFFYECANDSPIWPMIETLRSLSRAGNWVYIWSGRSESVREQTISWLGQHGLVLDGDERHYTGAIYRELRMRPVGDYTPDHELKERWLRELEPDWRPELVFDDRKRLVEMWRRNGIMCAQVAEGEF